MTEDKQTEFDDKLIELIEQNGRISYRDIAKDLGISERQAGYRFRRLLEEEVIRVITVVDAYAVGFNVILAIGVKVADRPAMAVAAELAEIPNVIASAVMAGEYDIEIMVAVPSHQALATLVREQLSEVTGIRSLHPSLFLDVVKYETGSGPVHSQPSSLSIPESSTIADADKAIINELWDNPLETNENIAKTLGMSETTVRNRVNRLRKNGVIHITAVRNVALGPEMVFASIGIELAAGHHEQVIEQLSRLRQVHFLANVLGRYDVMAQVLVKDTSELSAFLSEVLSPMPGIRSARAEQSLQVLKYDYRWRIVGPNS
jgi:Lrp/AsnC family transcriptional regulator for asnA, asnC and gidA